MEEIPDLKVPTVRLRDSNHSLSDYTIHIKPCKLTDTPDIQDVQPLLAANTQTQQFQGLSVIPSTPGESRACAERNKNNV